MKKEIVFLVLLSLLFVINSCYQRNPNKILDSSNKSLKSDKDTLNLLTDFIPRFEDGDVNAIIEIPAGTLDKWELDKSNGKIQWELVDNKPRIVKYLGYPGNYGMIPRTLLSTENGGDGDPLDIIVLGASVERGSVIKCKIIGVLYLMDRGEQDDKLIAVSENSPLYEVNSIAELNENYKGISDIIHLWFTNYKGAKKMSSKGFGERNNAIDILRTAINEYQLNSAKHNNVNKRQ